MAGATDVVTVYSKEFIGVSSPFNYKIKSRRWDGEETHKDSVKRYGLYENTLESRFSSGKDLQNFIFDDRIRAIRDAFEVYAEEGRVKPTYDILYKEFKTWHNNFYPDGSLKSIETGVPDPISKQVFYSLYE